MIRPEIAGSEPGTQALQGGLWDVAGGLGHWVAWMGAGQAVGPGQSGAGEDGAESLPTRKYMHIAEPSCLVSVYLRNPGTLYVSLSLCASDHLHRDKLLDYLGIYCFNCCCST